MDIFPSRTRQEISALLGCIIDEILCLTEPDAVALLTRLAGKTLVKNPNKVFAGLTWTARDVGGPCVEAFGMISEHSSPHGQGRLVT